MNVILAATGMGSKAVRMAEEVEHLLRMTAWLRECLEGELASGLGTAGKHGVDSKTLSKWSELVKCFDTLSGAKTRLDKNAKSAADLMTPDEELEAVRAYVRALEPKKRAAFLSTESDWHVLNGVPV